MELAVGFIKIIKYTKKKRIIRKILDYTIVYFMDNQFIKIKVHEESLKIAKEQGLGLIYLFGRKIKADLKMLTNLLIYSDDFFTFIWSNEGFFKAEFSI